MTEPTHRGLKGLLHSLHRKRVSRRNDTQDNDGHCPPRSQPNAQAIANNSQPTVDQGCSTSTLVDSSGGSNPGFSVETSAQHVHTQRPTAPHLLEPGEQATQLISSRLWNKAYNNLKDTEPELVDTYETILSQQLVEEAVTWVTRTAVNILANCDEQTRFARMKSIVLKVIEKSTQHGNLKEGVAQTVTVLTKLGSAVTPLLAPYPPASMALSGVCTVLPMLMGPLVAEKAMTDGLNHVIERMDWYMKLADVLLEKNWDQAFSFSELSSGVEQSIVNTYKALLEYEMQSVAYCYKDHPIVRGMKTIMGFNDWEARLDNIQTLEGQLDQVISQYNVREILQHLDSVSKSTSLLGGIAQDTRLMFEQQRAFQSAQQQREREEMARTHSKIIGMFKTTSYEERMRFNPEIVPGTCEWFRSHDKFKQWQKETNGLLLVSADPGCGKSVLARHLVENLLPSDASAAVSVCYFFFKDTPEQKSLSNALCAWLHNLFSSNPLLVKHCEEKILHGGAQLTSSARGLWDVFQQAVRHSSVQQVVCVLDALDECDPEQFRALVQLLREFLLFTNFRRTERHVKFLVTTRGYPEILEEFVEFESACIHLSGDNTMEKQQIQREVNLVVDHLLVKLAARKRLSPQRQDQIQEALQQATSENRTYLWVSLLFDVLNRNFNDTTQEWEKLIKNPPTTVFRVYENLLSRVEADDFEQIKLLLHLIVAAERPLTLKELNIAIQIRDRTDIASEEELDLSSDDNFRKWLIHTCGFFITEYDGRVFFIHQTAKEFLLRTKDGRAVTVHSPGQSFIWKSSVTMPQAHRSMAESCIAYLSLRSFRDGAFQKMLTNHCRQDASMLKDTRSWDFERLISPFRSFALFDYAIRFWLNHFIFGQEKMPDGRILDIGPEFEDRYFLLFDDKPPIAMPWLIMAAASYRQKCYYKLIISDESEESSIYPNKWPRLVRSVTTTSLAALFGHVRLLKRHHDIMAAKEDKEDDIPQLCEADCVPFYDSRDVNLEPPSFHNQPVFFAACLGHVLSLEQTICPRSPQLEARDGLFRTPLHLAAYHKQHRAVKQLLEYGANPGALDAAGWSSLDYSVYKLGNPSHDLETVETIKLLLSKGARLNSNLRTKSRRQWTPRHVIASILHLVAKSHGSFGPVHESLTALANFSEAADQSQSFLKMHQESFIKFLVDMGEDINLKDGEGRTPLNVACALPNVWNVLLMLQHNPEVDSKDNSGQTPLHKACFANHLRSPAIVAVLLKYGASVKVADRLGRTPLHHASDSNSTVIIQMLLDAGTLVDAPGFHGRTPLMCAAAAMQTAGNENLSVLLREGASLEARDRDGFTALHHACYTAEPQLKRVEMLLDAGADMEARDNRGHTPLHLASNRPSTDIIHLLLDRGADASAVNYVEQTPLDIAVENEIPEVVTVLEQHRGVDETMYKNAPWWRREMKRRNIDADADDFEGMWVSL